MPIPRCVPVSALLLAAAVLAGCESNPIMNTNTTVLVPVAGGKMASMTFGNNGPIAEENGDFKVATILPLAPSKEAKRVDYDVKLKFKGGARPTRIKVEDVSEDPIVLVMEDASPHLDQGVWEGKIIGLDSKDRRIGWVLSLEDSVRVLRFTVVLADGRTDTIEQAVSYPAVLKTMVRKVLGVDY